MSDINQEVRSHVDSFVTGLGAIIQKAMQESVGSAFGAAVEPNGHRVARKNGVKIKAVKAKSNGNGHARAEKRSAEAIAEMGERIKKFVAANPGSGMEQITTGLKEPTALLMLPIRKLLADKDIKKTGEKRGTKYFAK